MAAGNVLNPKTYYDFLIQVKRLKLKLGPLEGAGDAMVNHALSRQNSSLTCGFWDHQANAGYIDLDKVALVHRADAAVKALEVKPAPPIPDGDKDWDL